MLFRLHGASKSIKVLLLLLIAFILVVIQARVWRVFDPTQLESNQVLVNSQDGKAISLRIVSTVPEFTFKENSLNQAVVEDIFEAVGYGDTWHNFNSITTGEVVPVSKITFVFQRLEELSPTERQRLLDTYVQDNQIVKGSSAQYDRETETITYTTYLGESFLSAANGHKDVYYIYVSEIVRGLFLASEINVTSQDPSGGYTQFSQKAGQAVREGEEQLFSFQLSYNLLENAIPLINTVLEKTGLVSEAYAQGYCTGNYKCGYKSYSNCTCSEPGNSCSKPGDKCGVSGTCGGCDVDCSGGWTAFGCGDTESQCLDAHTCSGDQYCSTPVSESCNWTATSLCSSGESYCGGCINACRNTSTKTCNQWIDEECSDPDPSGTPYPTPTPTPQPWPGYLETVVQVWEDTNGDGDKNPGEASLNIPVTININIPGHREYNLSYPSHANFDLGSNSARFSYLRTQDGGGCWSGSNSTKCWGGPIQGDGSDNQCYCQGAGYWAFWPQLGLGDTDNGVYSGNYLLTSLNLGMGACNMGLIYNISVPSGWEATYTKRYTNGGWEKVGGNEIYFTSKPRNTQPACSADWKIVRSPVVMFGIRRVYNKSCSITSDAMSRNPADVINYDDSINFNVGGYSENPSSEPTRLILAKSDYSQWQNPPQGLAESGPWEGRYYYIASDSFDCSTGNGASCQDYLTLSDLPVGDYKAHCDLPTDPQKCSGNLACSYEGGTEACSGWESCSTSDNYQFSVQCSPACGQTAQCPTTDGTAPGNLNITSYDPPRDGTTFEINMPSFQDVTINWASGGSYATEYEVMIYPVGMSFSEAQANCGTSSYCTTTTTPSITYDPDTLKKHDLWISVRAANDSCEAYPIGTSYSPLWYTEHFTLVGSISGNFYVVSENICTGTGDGPATLANTTLASTININDSVTSTDITENVSGENYQVDRIPYVPLNWLTNLRSVLTINNDPDAPESAYVCAQCNQAGGNPYVCEQSNLLTSPDSDVNFYLYNYNLSNGPWFQWVNGVAFGGSSFNSSVSNDCVVNCSPYMAIRTSSQANENAGIPITGANSIIDGSGDPSQRQSTPGIQPGQHAMAQDFGAVSRKDYDYYRALFNVNEITNTLDGNITNYSEIENAGSLEIEDAKVLYSSGGLVINATNASRRWNVPAGEKLIIMVNGNLTINGEVNATKVIAVEEGGFLAFIVNGTIRFENSVGHVVNESSNPQSINDANVEGIFVGDNIVIASDGVDSTQDNKFIGAGSFTGWDYITLERTFDDTEFGKRFHNNSPTELFFYRPDFLYNTPRAMQEASIFWQEQS